MEFQVIPYRRPNQARSRGRDPFTCFLQYRENGMVGGDAWHNVLYITDAGLKSLVKAANKAAIERGEEDARPR